MEKIILVVSSLIFMATICAGQNETCGENQVWQSCGTACPGYCYDDPFRPCTLQCVAGCFCANGYTRQYIDDPTCIEETTCNTRAIQCEDTRKTYYTCGSMCPAYCGQPEDEPCPLGCEVGCGCKPGYVKKNKNSDECIPPSECPGAKRKSHGKKSGHH